MADLKPINYFFTGNSDDNRGVQYYELVIKGRADAPIDLETLKEPEVVSFFKDDKLEVMEFLKTVGDHHSKTFTGTLSTSNILTEVFQKFDILVPEVKEFYKRFLKKEDPSGTSPVFLSSLDDTAIKAFTATTKVTLTDSFSKMVPSVSGGAFRDAYDIGFKGTPGTSTNKSFSKFNNYLIYRATGIRKPTIPKDLKPSSILDFALPRIWEFKDGEFWATIDGKKVKYGDDQYEKIMSAGKCDNLGIPEDKCSDFISKCIINEDPKQLQQCMEAIKVYDFEATMPEQIKKMHPKVALMLLQKFHIDTVHIYDPVTKMEVIKVQSLEDWLSGLKAKGVEDSTINAIIGAEKLKRYIELLILYINSEPAILNSGFTGQTAESTGTPLPSKYIESLKIGMRVDPPLVTRTIGLKGYVQALSGFNPAKDSAYFLAPSFRMPFPQLGGGKHVSTASVVREIIDGLVHDLKARGQVLDERDVAKIQGHLKTLEVVESQLLKVFEYLQQYRRMADANRAMPNKDLQMHDIEAAVDKFNSTFSHKDMTMKALLDVISKLGEHLVSAQLIVH